MTRILTRVRPTSQHTSTSAATGPFLIEAPSVNREMKRGRIETLFGFTSQPDFRDFRGKKLKPSEDMEDKVLNIIITDYY